MNKLLASLLLLLPLLLLIPGASWVQDPNVIAGAACGAPGVSAVATNGVAVRCQGAPLVWTATSGSGGGITSVAVLAALPCASGTTVFLNTGQTGNYTCVNGAWVGPSLGGGFANAIAPAAYGVKMDVKMCRDTNAKFTTTTTVTCSTGGFLSTDCTGGSGCTGTANKVIFGTCCGLQGGSTHPASVLILPQGTIQTFISSTQVTVSLAGTATTCASGVAGCLLLWGTDDSAAWDAAWTGATGTAGICKAILVPTGMTFISTAKFLTTVCNTGITGPGSQGSSLVGNGYKTSMFVVLPNFVGAGCVGTSGAGVNPANTGCFGPSVGIQLLNMGIWGGENGNSTALNGKVFLDIGIDSYLTNVLLAGFASGTGTTMVGLQSESTGQTPSIVVVDGFGGGTSAQPECVINGGNYQVFVQSFCGNVNGRALLVTGAGTIFHDIGGLYGQIISSSDDVDVISGAKAIFTGTIITGPNAGAALGCSGASSIDILEDSVISNTGNAGIFFADASACKIRASNSTITGNAVGTDIAFTSAANNIWQDQGGNIITHASSTSTSCASSAAPAVCGNYGNGMFTLPAAATTATVNTTAVTANSIIIVFNDDSLGTRLGVTCNTGLDNVLVSARVAGTSFTVTGSAPVTNPNCYSYIIIN